MLEHPSKIFSSSTRKPQNMTLRIEQPMSASRLARRKKKSGTVASLHSAMHGPGRNWNLVKVERNDDAA
jgi:hypothetical protein